MSRWESIEDPIADDGWMQTFTGRGVWPTALNVDDIDIEDIAHALAMQCRFNGHVDRFYSTAEHCCHICDALQEDNKPWGLMHDAGEAYIGDIIRPLRNEATVLKAIEKTIEAKIAERFGLSDVVSPEIKKADTRILVNERNALMKAPPRAWVGVENVAPLPIVIQAWPPEQAKVQFLKRFNRLVRHLAPTAAKGSRHVA